MASSSSVYKFNGQNRLTRQEQYFGPWWLSEVQYKYDAVGFVTTAQTWQRMPRLNTATTTAFHRPMKTSTQQGHQSPQLDDRWQYDPNDYRGNVTHITTPLLTTINEYETDDEFEDAVGALIVASTIYNKPQTSEDPASAFDPTNVIPYLRTEYEYKKDGRLAKIQVIRNGKDTGNVSRKDLDLISVWEYYNDDGKLKRSIDANGLETEYTDYKNGNPSRIQVTDSYGANPIVTETNLLYDDSLGYLKESKLNPVGDSNIISKTTYFTDTAGRVVREKTVDKDGSVLADISFEFAADGLITSSFDSNGVQTEFIYDKAGMLTKTVEAKGQTYANSLCGSTAFDRTIHFTEILQ